MGRKAAITALAAAGVLAAGCADSAKRPVAAAGARQALIANTLDVGPGDGWTPLLGVRGMGSFSVSCPHGTLRARLRATAQATLHATVLDGRTPRSKFLNPGKTWTPVAAGRVALQRWVLGITTEATAQVATVSISASRATTIGSPGCQVEGQAAVVRRQRTNRPPND